MTKNILKAIIVSLALLLVCGTAQAQFGKRLGNAIENAAKNATIRKAEQKTDEAVSKGIDKATDPDTYKDKDGNNVETPESNVSTKQPQQDAKVADMAYAKTDFVSGDEIIFEDLLTGEKLGEFPSMWNLVSGNAEIVSAGGQNAIQIMDNGKITPLMKTPKNYPYGITFDIGKSTIKPESMGEINRIAKLMTDNPALKFSVEGHTDNTGSAAINQTLSDARSAAVVAKLVKMGVAKDRLASAGKGQNSPIADNSTDEGRAKNRRVEFVKIN
ncbi:MAG: OmpA family protein [Tannerella sp.]|jgi:outer membrane protein OmpA-like peptidoglycan-associated protein|nr:OmpA family protein [Tannerella sp.]